LGAREDAGRDRGGDATERQDDEKNDDGGDAAAAASGIALIVVVAPAVVAGLPGLAREAVETVRISKTIKFAADVVGANELVRPAGVVVRARHPALGRAAVLVRSLSLLIGLLIGKTATVVLALLRMVDIGGEIEVADDAAEGVHIIIVPGTLVCSPVVPRTARKQHGVDVRCRPRLSGLPVRVRGGGPGRVVPKPSFPFYKAQPANFAAAVLSRQLVFGRVGDRGERGPDLRAEEVGLGIIHALGPDDERGVGGVPAAARAALLARGEIRVVVIPAAHRVNIIIIGTGPTVAIIAVIIVIARE